MKNLLYSVPVALLIAGCSFLKPVGVTPRSFILTPAEVTALGGENPRVPSIGVGRVTVPNYLMKKTMAMRREGNEMVYLETTLWAERLDIALQRVIASDLAALLPKAQVRTVAWRAEDVAAQLSVQVEQFDVDDRGKCVLNATWRWSSADHQKLLASGTFARTRDAASPVSNPQAAVSAMSALVGEFCLELARSIEQ